MVDTNDWTVVGDKKRKSPVTPPRPPPPSPITPMKDKISEPCWFYNHGGCRHKDGSDKSAIDCKYLHLYSENVQRPPHLCIRKPCDKYNLEGECKWHDSCKYSHRNLNAEEWSRFYPGIPYTLKTNIQKRVQIEARLAELEGRLRVIEYKQEGISRDVQHIGRIVRTSRKF